jgi:uncharacterized protein YegL
MSEQITREQLFGGIAAPSEPHMACVLLLDISSSMEGAPIQSLNEAIAKFKQQVCQDPLARKRVEVAIVTFETHVEIVSDFMPIDQMPTINLQAGGQTHMAEAIQVAIDLVKKRTREYQGVGVPCFKPWIFMITDGVSMSSAEAMEAAAARIHEEENKGTNGRLKFWALGVDDYDKDELFRLTNRVIELQQHEFTGIFDWLVDSMSAISKSQVGEKIQLESLPEDAGKAANVDSKDVSDW